MTIADDEYCLKSLVASHLNEWFSGVVKDVRLSNAVISIDGIPGVLRANDFAGRERIDDLRDFVSEGDEIEVVVIGYDENERTILFGGNQSPDDPFLSAVDGFSIGKEVEGKVKWNNGRNIIIVINGIMAKANKPSDFTCKTGQKIKGTVSEIDVKYHLLRI